MLKGGKKAPPASPAPFNMDEVEIVRRKVAPPAGPPPPGMQSFTAPKKVETIRSSRDDGRGSETSRSPTPERFVPRSRSPSPPRDRDRYRARDRDRSRSRSSERERAPRRRDSREHTRNRSRSPSPDSYDREHYRNQRRSPSPEEDHSSRRKGQGNAEYKEDLRAAPPKRQETSDSFKEYMKKLPETKDVKTAAESLTEKEIIFNFNLLMKTTYRELRAFIMSPPPQNTVVRCYIERNNSGMNMFNPVYSLCADLDDGTGRELICCRKITSRSAHYVFSLKADDLYRRRDQRSRLYLGKLRATSANEYVLYDGGSCDMPEGTGAELLSQDRSETASELASKAVEDSLYRSQLAVIHFNSKRRPCEGNERGMEVCIPHPSLVVAPPPVAEGAASKKILVDLVGPFEKIRAEGRQNDMYRHKVIVFHERVSRYDALSSCLVDFKGRAAMASVKNFQLVRSQPMARDPPGLGDMAAPDPRTIAMQMGKITKDAFNMDFRGQMSMLQCFAACIARFDANLSW